MSRTRVYSAATMGVMDRFFTALEICREQRILKVNKYCDQHGINASHLYLQRKERCRGFFEIGWAIPLVRSYGVSSFWLLTGLGTMFAPKGAREYEEQLPSASGQ